MPNNLTADELYASLGLTQPATTGAEPKPKEEKPKFLTKQFTLWSCPALTIYLQGVHTFPSSTPQAELVYAAFASSTARRIHKGALTATAATIEDIAKNKTLLYTNKEWHMNAVRSLLEGGMRLEVTKVAHKPTVEASIEAYMDALAEFLTASGYDSPEAYLAAKAATTDNILTLEGLQNVWDNL